MLDTYQDFIKFPTALEQARRAKLIHGIFLLGLAGLSGVLALSLILFGTHPAMIAWLLFFAGAVLILRQPRYGLYLILFLALVGDGFLSFWYPFTKNFSSKESLMYLSDSVSISPMECYMILTLSALLLPAIMQRQPKFYVSRLFWPAIAFTVFIIYGLIWGIGRGGSVVIGLWEARPIFYIPILLFLANNLITRRQHINHLMWLAMLALFIEGLNGAYFYFFVLGADLSGTESITEHSAAIHMNTFFIFMIAVWLYKGSLFKRILLLLMASPVLLTYLAAQRRAAFVTIIVALIFLAIILLKENRAAFVLIVPPLAVLGLLYLAVFWNQGGALALPAQAVKSVIAEDQASQQDQLSNIYRVLENVNAHYNIRSQPITGVGFGQKIGIIVPLPDISFFVWWEYIIHNSIIWIWIKTGIGGFVTLLFLIGLSILEGMKALIRLPSSDISAATLTAVLYIMMHFIYAYVDMSWDNQSMIYVGTMMGIISVVERIVEIDIPTQKKRWPWQAEPKPSPLLRPLTGERAA